MDHLTRSVCTDRYLRQMLRTDRHKEHVRHPRHPQRNVSMEPSGSTTTNQRRTPFQYLKDGSSRKAEFLNWGNDRWEFFVRNPDGSFEVATPILPIPRSEFDDHGKRCPFPECPVAAVRYIRLLFPPVRGWAEDDPSRPRSAAKPLKGWESAFGEVIHPTKDDDRLIETLLAETNSVRGKHRTRSHTRNDLLTVLPRRLRNELWMRWAEKHGFRVDCIGQLRGRWRPGPRQCLDWFYQNAPWRYQRPKFPFLGNLTLEMTLLAQIRFVAEFVDGNRVFLSGFTFRTPRADEVSQIQATEEARPKWHSDDYATIWLPNSHGSYDPVSVAPSAQRMLKALNSAPGKALSIREVGSAAQDGRKTSGFAISAYLKGPKGDRIKALLKVSNKTVLLVPPW